MTPLPRLMARNIYEISPQRLQALGIRLLLLDVDNTIAPYGFNEVLPELRAWASGFAEAGIRLFILSNNRGQRPRIFAEALCIGYVGKAGKPLPFTAKRLLRELDVPPDEAAVLGDQCFTDGLCASLCGMCAIVVTPIKMSNLLLRVRYWAELPFRLAYRMRTNKIED